MFGMGGIKKQFFFLRFYYWRTDGPLASSGMKAFCDSGLLIPTLIYSFYQSSNVSVELELELELELDTFARSQISCHYYEKKK